MIGGAKGIGLGLDFGIGNQLRPQNSKPYIEQAVLDSLCGVWIADQNKNESPTRDTIKNKLKDRGGDFKILNAAYGGMSGFNGYDYDFNSSIFNIQSGWAIKLNDHTVKVLKAKNSIFMSANLRDITMKIKVTGLEKAKNRNEIEGKFIIYNSTTDTGRTVIQSDGIHEVNIQSGVDTGAIYFYIPSKNVAKEQILTSPIVIEEVAEYQGAFITDGVDDLIVSEKSMTEILNGSNEFTVISMIHQIDIPKTVGLNNVVTRKRESGVDIYYQPITLKEKTGIYGYTYKDNSIVTINNILGDKNDYKTSRGNDNSYNDQYSVEGYINKGNYIYNISNVAWYWTFIANKVLTSDQINQVIEYFNLDKYVKPDVLYNVKKQGITNDNHEQFGDKLIDYSGNGRDMQLYNIGWKGVSGIGKYAVSLDVFDIQENVGYNKSWNKVYFKCDVGNGAWIINKLVYSSTERGTIQTPSFYINLHLVKGKVEYIYTTYNNTKVYKELSNGINEIPISYRQPTTDPISKWHGFLADDGSEGYIELIPEYEGALVLDGVNDYGKVEDMPIYKDYTVVVDRESLNKDNGTTGSVVSKSDHHSAEGTEYGAFIFEISVNNYSFNINPTRSTSYNKDRIFSYLSKYLYNGETVTVGTATDSSSMWLGTIRDNDPRFSNLAFYSAMTFPYSLSKFLIERQLKKHKLGSFYEKDMIPFRPEISSNVPYDKIGWYTEDWKRLEVGDYIPIGSTVKANIYLTSDIDEIAEITSNQGTVTFSKSADNVWDLVITDIEKKPLKIDITIGEYIRFEDIVQPYPIFMTLIDSPFNGIRYTWGTKLKIGREYIVAGWDRLFEEDTLYSTTDNFKMFYNDTQLLNGVISRIIAEKKMVFRQEGVEWILDYNKPKCILSPELLRIPNESYEYLGYIPDISGHGNHGYIYNSAYDETSGMNSDGSFKLNGVNDYISLDSMTGGKQMFMKLQWDNGEAQLVYDQRKVIGNDLAKNFALLTIADNDIAYSSRNQGDTYIDGLKNKHITNATLKGVIHNATLNDENAALDKSPIIGKSIFGNLNYAKMSLYTFMLFDEISSPEKIKELNDIIGIDNSKYDVAPPYYYDTYGKTNNTPDKNVLINMGTGGNHDLNLLNFGFNGEDGYCDVTFDGPWNIVTVDRDIYDNKVIIYDLTSVYDHSVNQYNDFIWGKWLTQYDNPKPSDDTSSFYTRFSGIPEGGSIAYLYVNEDGTIDKKIMNENGVYYLLPASYNTRYVKEPDALQAAKMGFMAINPWEATSPLVIEVCKGLILDGVDDSLINTTIPALTDYTYALKRQPIEKIKGSASMYKGTFDLQGGRAFIADFINSEGIMTGFSFGNSIAAPVSSTTDDVVYGTKTSINGASIIPGNKTDDNGLTIGKRNVNWKGAFYKMLLWDKTISNLSIQMMKNLIEEDNVIDMNNPIFKK